MVATPKLFQDYFKKKDLARISDTDAVHLFAAAFQSQLSHLKKASATVDFVEINRTLISALALKWILTDDYSSFTRGQRIPGQLSQESFRELTEAFTKKLQSRDDIYGLFVAIMIDDFVKDRALAPLSTANSYHAAMAALIPALAAVLAKKCQDDILGSLWIKTKMSIPQLVQGEGVPASLRVLRELQGKVCACDMRAMVTILSVASAGAHMNAQGCIMMTESVYQAYMDTIRTLNEFLSGTIPDECACYNRILTYRAELLHRKGFDLLSTQIDEERALLRMLCMGNVDSRESAEVFKKAFSILPPLIRQDLVNGLNVGGLSDGTAIVPCCAHSLLAEMLPSLAKREEPAVVEGVSSFMRFLARVLDGSGSIPRSDVSETIVERDLSFIQDTIKSTKFVEDPSILDSVRLSWK